MAGLIAGLRDFHWLAIKITQFGHGVCSANGEACDCETADHTIAVSEERAPSRTDTGRYLAAGAARSLWIRTRQGQLVEAMPRIRQELARSTNTLIESNSILRFVRPDLYLTVLDPAVSDFKSSARRYLDRADAILRTGETCLAPDPWKDISPNLYRGIPVIRIQSPTFVSPELLDFVRGHLAASSTQPESSPDAQGVPRS